jgi:hypothetical protein
MVCTYLADFSVKFIRTVQTLAGSFNWFLAKASTAIIIHFLFRRSHNIMTKWTKNGVDAAQLFRDIYFDKIGKYTRAGEAHAIPDRSYHHFNKNGFFKHYKNVKERVDTFKRFGTGLDDENFKRKIRLHEPPSQEEQGATLTVLNYPDNEDEESLDETYQENGEDDITLDDAFELESFLGNLTIADNKKKTTPVKKKTNQPTKIEGMVTMRASTMTNNVLGKKILTEYPDGRFSCVVKLNSGFNGTFVVSEDGTKVIQKEYVPSTLCCAKNIYYKMGLDDQDVHVVTLQAEIDRLKKDAKKGEGGFHYDETVIFNLPVEVVTTFVDNKGNPDHRVNIGTDKDGVEWAYFFMVGIQAKKVSSPEPKIQRDRTRHRARESFSSTATSSADRNKRNKFSKEELDQLRQMFPGGVNSPDFIDLMDDDGAVIDPDM